VFLTVLRSNVAALDFYTRLKYVLDERTPSKHGMEASHEILSKCVDPSAAAAAAAVAAQQGQ
jgi:hypothetical protein